MRHLIIIPSVFLALVLSAQATNVELPITPNQLDQQNYHFSVSANATNQFIAFHVVITAKQDAIESDSEANLSIVTHTKNKEGSRSGTSIAAFTPPVAITFHKDKDDWTVDFTLPRKSLKTPGLCFIFSELAHDTVNGRRMAMPSITFYEIKLKDFVKE